MSTNIIPPLYGSREWYQQHQSHAGKRSAEINDMSALGRRGARETLRKYGYLFLFHLEISHTQLTTSEFDTRQRIIEFLLA